MRTTVTLDPDVEHLLRRRMSEKKVSFKRALNDAIRESAAARPVVHVETPTFDLGVPAIDLTKAMRISAELEDETLIAGLRRGA
jgi:hypothetical protein